MLRLAYCIMTALAVTSFAAAGTPLGEEDARHLLNRTGFNATAAEIAAFAPLRRDEAARQLLQSTRNSAITPPPAWVDEPPPAVRMGQLDEEEKKQRRQLLRERGIALRSWWYQEMLDTPSPLSERMTLFWHNHFVSAEQKVRLPQFMYQQNVLLRQQALGNFGTLLHAIARNPAMLIYLDGVQNRKGAANENFAREVMELFTVGEGHYTEQDIREAARALTGMSLDRDSGQYRFRPAQHDTGNKTLFGKTGNFNADDFLDLLLQKPETAQFLSAKLWREFVSPEPNPREIKRLAQVLRDNHYEIKPWLRALLTSDAFYAPENRGVLIKSPVELAIGTLRQFHIEPQDWRPVLFVNHALGQDIFNPPNVKGWPGYTDWINAQTLLLRKQYLARAFRVSDAQPAMTVQDDSSMPMARMEKVGQRIFGRPGAVDVSVARWLNEAGGLPQASLVLLPLHPAELPDGAAEDAVAQLVLNPLYQLK